jgi:hypothetical protein
MKVVGVLLFVLPFVWVGLVISFWLIGRAGKQGLFIGMLGSGTSKNEADAFVGKSLQHQRGVGAFGQALWRGWPLAIASLGAGIWLLATN